MKRSKSLAARAAAKSRKKMRARVGVSLETATRVFISYRREDTADAVAHLHHSLEQQLGEGKVFRDVDTIQPGQNFENVIQEAIRSTSVCLVVIGPSWLTVKEPTGGLRLEAREDFVRKEIESALAADVEVIPILVDGAKMPISKQLPESIKELAKKHGYDLPWHAGVLKLGTRIEQIEQERQKREAEERAERERLDLTGGKGAALGTWRSQTAVASFNVLVRAMEISLARQGTKVWLSAAEFAETYQKLAKRSLDEGFMSNQVFHIVDFIGVKAKQSKRRYVARSYPLKGLEEIPSHLALGRPIMVGLKVQNSWLEAPILKTGLVDLHPKDRWVGAVLGAVLGWDPKVERFKVLSPWSTWGEGGIGTFTWKAAQAYMDRENPRSIEAVLMPEDPFVAES